MRLQADPFWLPTQPVDSRVGADRLTMFVVSEVHLFKDGNSRTARLVMNCVFSAASPSRIIVPTVSREKYLSSLRRLSTYVEAVQHVDAMTWSHRWGLGFDYGRSTQELQKALRTCNAFEEDHDVH